MPQLNINDADTEALYHYAASLSNIAEAPKAAPAEVAKRQLKRVLELKQEAAMLARVSSSRRYRQRWR